MTTIPDSTVALTIYNWLAVECAGCPRAISELERRVAIWAQQCQFDIGIPQITRARKELVRRRYVRELRVNKDTTLVELVDREHRPVLRRDRTGDGWSGWEATQFNRVPTIPIEQAIRG